MFHDTGVLYSLIGSTADSTVEFASMYSNIVSYIPRILKITAVLMRFFVCLFVLLDQLH